MSGPWRKEGGCFVVGVSGTRRLSRVQSAPSECTYDCDSQEGKRCICDQCWHLVWCQFPHHFTGDCADKSQEEYPKCHECGHNYSVHDDSWVSQHPAFAGGNSSRKVATTSPVSRLDESILLLLLLLLVNYLNIFSFLLSSERICINIGTDSHFARMTKIEQILHSVQDDRKGNRFFVLLRMTELSKISTTRDIPTIDFD